MKKLVETKWVHQNLKKIVPVDASWHMPSTGRNAFSEFQKTGHLHDARFFDIDTASDQTSPYPHMLPTAKDFEKYVGSTLGIKNDDHLVIYDNSDVCSAFRVYLTFKIFGHERLSVMNGGLSKWLSDGFEVERGEQKFKVFLYSIIA